jgi:sugar/nucleoside kinase (ribokinase family)
MSPVTVFGTSALHVLSSVPPTDALSLGRVELSVGGPAAVVACQLALLGHKARFVGPLGTDKAGRVVRSELDRYGVDVSAVIETAHTPRVLAVVGPDSVELAAEIGSERPAPDSWLNALPTDAPTGWRPEAPCYATGFPDLVPVIAALGAAGHRLLIDVGFIPLLSEPERLIEHVRSIASAVGIGVVSGQKLTPADRERLNDLILSEGGTAVLTTLGKDGVIVTTGDDATHIPAFGADCVDPLCAGDTFVAGVLSGLVEGLPILDAARFGQAVAAAKVSLFGELPTRTQVDAILATESESR